SRAGDGSATKSDKIDAQTAEFEFSAMADPYDYKIKGKTAQGSAKYDDWFTAVYVPGVSAPTV
ncbi:phage tail protein, partial [Weissella confusa]|nr:phage tail protein [Weissella confusa]